MKSLSDYTAKEIARYAYGFKLPGLWTISRYYNYLKPANVYLVISDSLEKNPTLIDAPDMGVMEMGALTNWISKCSLSHEAMAKDHGVEALETYLHEKINNIQSGVVDNNRLNNLILGD